MHMRHQGPYICAPDPYFRLERVIAERLAAAQEKKKQERDKRFLDGAATKLDNLLSNPIDMMKAATESIEEVHAKFLMDYAAASDRIHNIWAEILKHQLALETLMRDKRDAALELAKLIEGKHVSGLSKMKGVVDEYDVIIQSLVPEL
ncbi:hypothetical protein BKA70DRAFT_1264567, partial [Coprinopsis sp. MPI-PUGE-AT-0042]